MFIGWWDASDRLLVSSVFDCVVAAVSWIFKWFSWKIGMSAACLLLALSPSDPDINSMGSSIIQVWSPFVLVVFFRGPTNKIYMMVGLAVFVFVFEKFLATL